MTVFIYEIKRKVELTLRETEGLVNWNLPMDSNDFRIFKDVTNTIEFVVRDTDRKPINMMGRTAQITMYDQRNREMMWQHPLNVINDAKGLCQLNITSDVTSDWYLATYSYSITVQNLDGSVHMLYVDQHEGQSGFFELAQGPSFEPQPSVEIPGDKLKFEQQGEDDDLHYQFTSALPGSMKRHNFSGLHTAVAFFENFSGTLLVQGSIEEGTPTDSGEWFDIETRHYDHKTGADSFNILANLQWVRFRLWNRYFDDGSGVILDANKGKLVKLVYRN